MSKRAAVIFQASALLGAITFLVACMQNLEGVYKDDLGLQKYEFKNNGTVYISTMGVTQEATYVVQRKKVKIIKKGKEALLLDRNQDGTIKGPLGMNLKRLSEK